MLWYIPFPKLQQVNTLQLVAVSHEAKRESGSVVKRAVAGIVWREAMVSTLGLTQQKH